MNNQYITPFDTIVRAEDLPYWGSPPVQFVYESTAALALGQYIWTDLPSSLTPARPLMENALYFMRNVSLTADVEENDFTSNLVVTAGYPGHTIRLYTYLLGDSRGTPLYREPFHFNKFYDQFDFRFWFMPRRQNDELLCSFRGTLNQGPGLIGKANVTLKVVYSAQEVIDNEFVKQFVKRRFPDLGHAEGGPK